MTPFDVTGSNGVVLRFTTPIGGYSNYQYTLTFASRKDAKEVGEALRDGNFTVSLRTTRVMEEPF